MWAGLLLILLRGDWAMAAWRPGQVDTEGDRMKEDMGENTQNRFCPFQNLAFFSAFCPAYLSPGVSWAHL